MPVGWTEVLGFKQVGVSLRRGGKMRFYSGNHGGQMNHHDIALCENPDLPKYSVYPPGQAYKTATGEASIEELRG